MTQPDNNEPQGKLNAKTLTFVAVISFLIVSGLLFYLFVNFDVERITASAISMVSGFFVVYMIMRANGIKLDWKFKGLGIETELKESIKNVQRDVTESNKEICGKINNLNQNIQLMNNKIENAISNTFNANANQNQSIFLGDLVKQVADITRELLLTKMNQSGLNTEHLDKNAKISEGVLEEIKSLRKNQASLERLLEQIQNKPRTIDSHDMLHDATITFYDGEYKRTLNLLEKILEKDPQNLVILHNKAVTLDKLKRLNEAKQTYEKILKISPKNVPALKNLGGCYYDMGKYDEALDCAKRALEISPNDAELISNVGAALIRLGKYDEAGKYFNDALKINSKIPQIYYNMACLSAITGDKAKALTLLEKAIEQNPEAKINARTDLDFNSIRQDPQFKKLVE